jgi:hypothetical protein
MGVSYSESPRTTAEIGPILINVRCNLKCFRLVQSFDLLWWGSSPHSAFKHYTSGEFRGNRSEQKMQTNCYPTKIRISKASLVGELATPGQQICWCIPMFSVYLSCVIYIWRQQRRAFGTPRVVVFFVCRTGNRSTVYTKDGYVPRLCCLGGANLGGGVYVLFPHRLLAFYLGPLRLHILQHGVEYQEMVVISLVDGFIVNRYTILNI